MTLLRTAGAPPATDDPDNSADLRAAVAALVAAQAQTQAALQQLLQAPAQTPPARSPTAPPARAGPGHGRTVSALGLLLGFGVLAVASQRLLPLDTWLIALVVALPILRVLLALAGFTPPLRGRY